MAIENMYRRPVHNGDERDVFSRISRPSQSARLVRSTKLRAVRRTRRSTRQNLHLAGRVHSAIISQLRAGTLDFTNLAEDYDELVSA